MFTNRFHNPFKLFKRIDHFGKTPQLYFDRKSKHGSAFGGFMTLLVISLAVYLLYRQINSWIGFENVTIIASTTNFNNIDLIAHNISKVYNFTPQNFYPYFTISALLSNGTSLNLTGLRNYIFINLTYTNQYYERVSLDYEPCYFKKQDSFLNLEADLLAKDGEEQSNWSICLKNPPAIGMYPDIESNQLNLTAINLQVYLCKNQVFCANEPEMKHMLKYVSIAINMPRTTFDYSSKESQSKHLYEAETYYLDFVNAKYVNSYLAPVFLFSDYGVFSDDYHLDSTDFNVDKKYIDTYFRDIDEPSFSYYIQLGSTNYYNYRRNQKLQDVIGSFGGLIGLIIRFTNIICIFYNSRSFKEKLLNNSFRFSSKDEQTATFAKCKKLKFGFCEKLLFSFKANRKGIYKNAMNYFYEFMDLKKIILRMQEIEKMKQILFDPQQLLLFEMIPKPVVSDYDTRDQFKIEKIKASTEKKTIKIPEICLNLKDKSSEVNQRLLNLLEKDSKSGKLTF